MLELSAEPPIKCFISYARADDLVMQFVDRFAEHLARYALADRNRQIEPFIDRESIAWGEQWKPRIRDSLASAAVFMPIVTRQYFERQSCRDELLTFHSEAERLGVQSLVLPVVVLGHEYLTEETTDPAARIIADRQYKNLREAWIEGPDSSVWRRDMVDLANDLVDVVEAAERTLSNSPTGAPTVPLPDDRPGSIELAEATEKMAAVMEQIIGRIQVTMERITQVFETRAGTMTGLEGEQARQAIRETAAEIEPLGQHFETDGAELEKLVLETDAVFRGYVAHLLETGTAEEIREARVDLESSRDELGSMAEVQQVVTEFLEQLHPLELASAPMRVAFRPLRAGMISITTAINLLRHWPDILDDEA